MATEKTSYDQKIDLTIQGHQIHVHGSDFSANLHKIQELIQNSTADVVVFPEACTSGFAYKHLPEISEHSNYALESIQATARYSNRSVLLPLLIRESESFYNRQHFISADGEVLAVYDKIHLIGALHEDRYLQAGRKPVVFSLPLPRSESGERISVGLATCYDLRFPELFRAMTMEMGAELFLLPAMWPVARKDHFTSLVRARAIENQTPLLACNSVGQTGSMDLCGSSCAIDARGSVQDMASDTEVGSVLLKLSRSHTLQWRETFPALQDRVIY